MWNLKFGLEVGKMSMASPTQKLDPCKETYFTTIFFASNILLQFGYYFLFILFLYVLFLIHISILDTVVFKEKDRIKRDRSQRKDGK